jgi:tRNA threonylcarbamoyladenosine biosynthesis protein TsaE
MATHISKSPEETLRLGEQIGTAAQPGLVIGLIGELGAGKTQFVKGVAIGLGITERIHSPTFALLNEYKSGRLPCYHIDLYRLESPEQILRAGLDDYIFQENGVTVIEWFERLDKTPLKSAAELIVRLRELSNLEREITYEYPRS